MPATLDPNKSRAQSQFSGYDAFGLVRRGANDERFSR